MSHGRLHVRHQRFRLNLICPSTLSFSDLSVLSSYIVVRLSLVLRDSEYGQCSGFFSPFRSRIISFFFIRLWAQLAVWESVSTATGWLPLSPQSHPRPHLRSPSSCSASLPPSSGQRHDVKRARATGCSSILAYDNVSPTKISSPKPEPTTTALQRHN